MTAPNTLYCLVLLQTRRMTKVQLSEALGVSERTIRRYLATIETAGFEMKWNFVPGDSRQDVRIYWVTNRMPIGIGAVA